MLLVWMQQAMKPQRGGTQKVDSEQLSDSACPLGIYFGLLYEFLTSEV